MIVNQQCFAEGRLRALAGDRDGAADAFVAALEVRDLTPRHQVDAGSTDHMLYTLLDRVGGCPNTNPPPDTSPPPEGAFTDKEYHQSGPYTEFPYDAATTRHNMCNGMENKPNLYSTRRKKTSLTKDETKAWEDSLRLPTCPPSLTITGSPELKHGLAADRRRPSASKVGGEFGRATEMLDAQPALCRVLPCKGKIDDEDATVCLFSVAQDTLVQIFELAASDAAEGRPARKARWSKGQVGAARGLPRLPRRGAGDHRPRAGPGALLPQQGPVQVSGARDRQPRALHSSSAGR